MIKTYDCTSGGAQWCQGCYTMEESTDGYGRPDGYGSWISKEDHDKVAATLSAALDRIAFLERQIRIEQDERKQDAAKYAIIEARYKQIEDRWHKLMERSELQCSNRLQTRGCTGEYQ